MSISASSLGNHGRIGNACFQVACVLGTAEKNNTVAALPYWEYEKYFEDALPHGQMSENVYLEKEFGYEQITGNDLDLHGYWQSAKYFPKDYRPRFKKEFIQQLKNHEAFKKETIGIHIRKGDYKNNPLYFQLPITWYISALLSIDNWQSKNIVIISDEIAYAKVHFECLRNVYFMSGNDIEDLAYYSLCDIQILSNSTYSWWGCYLSEKRNGIHSGKLFDGNFLYKNIEDFYLPQWEEHKEMQLDLKDLTFTIPVYYDHIDRKKNLDLCVCILQNNFKTNIIIGEQGWKRFEYMEKWCKYVHFDYEVFHRTRMLNQMALMSETPYIANWDCDIIIPPLQIWLAVEQLRNGSDMVFPYDGRFARYPRQTWFRAIEKHLDIGVIGDAEPKGKGGRKVPETSVGGAVMFNKESFIKGGMENENMISFGPEDAERNDRFTMLGFKITRTGGFLCHIDHYCGPNSSIRNVYFKANHLELDKIRQMSKAELQNYIQTWEWLTAKEFVEAEKYGGNKLIDKLKFVNGNSIQAVVYVDDKPAYYLNNEDVANLISEFLVKKLTGEGRRFQKVITKINIPAIPMEQLKTLK